MLSECDSVQAKLSIVVERQRERMREREGEREKGPAAVRLIHASVQQRLIHKQWLQGWDKYFTLTIA